MNAYPQPLYADIHFQDFFYPKGAAFLHHFSHPLSKTLQEKGYFAICWKKNVGSLSSKENLFRRGLICRAHDIGFAPKDSSGVGITLQSARFPEALYISVVDEMTVESFRADTLSVESTVFHPTPPQDPMELRERLIQSLIVTDSQFPELGLNIPELKGIQDVQELINSVYLFMIQQSVFKQALTNPEGPAHQFFELDSVRDRCELLIRELNEYHHRKTTQTSRASLTASSGDSLNISKFEKFLDDATNMSPDSIAEIKQKIALLKSAKSTSETSSLLEYLETVMRIPWGVLDSNIPPFTRMRQMLDENMFGMKEAKDRLLEHIAVMLKTKGHTPGSALCLIGPPGTGKTLFAKSAASILGRQSFTISLGGVDDVTILRGQRRGWVGSESGQLVKGLISTKTMNPVMILDEIDKISGQRRDQVQAALLEVLDPMLNKEFKDAYIDLPVNLSNILFIGTANYYGGLPPALRDRMEFIEIDPYTPSEKLQIAKDFVIPFALKRAGASPTEILFQNEALQELVESFRLDAGMRRIEQTVNQIIRKILILQIESESQKNQPFIIEASNINQFTKLGDPQQFLFDPTSQAVGEISMLWAATDEMGSLVGGGRSPLQIQIISGSGRRVVTGSIQDVFRESISVAFGYIQTHANELGIDQNFFRKHDILIHAPSASVKKEGPSAGVALVLCLLSAIKNVPVLQGIGVTGEVDLLGNVLPVGSIKTKVSSAYWAGMRTFVLPVRNKREYENDVAEDIKHNVTVHFIKNISEVISMFFPEVQ